jgi:hypothetical protein
MIAMELNYPGLWLVFGGGSSKTASYPLTISFSRFHG